ncbi:MAG: hydrogenase maturation nickel metallochaperone HypA [Firmicutes bacterium]|nr:hydrogenase maturation nickel metallochaperone HypA [Bacillota bacterium]
MHELPITERIIKIAGEHCRAGGASRVTKIHLVIGDNSGIVGSSVQMYFDVITEGTPCEGAELDIVRVRPKLRCKSCGCLFERALLSFSCPECGGDGEPTEIGKEFYIDTIEVE